MKQTPNLKLPQWEKDDVTSWMTQLNSAMLLIDSAVHAIMLRTSIDGVPEEAISDIEKLNNQVSVLQETVANMQDLLNKVDSETANLDTNVTQIMQQLNTLTINYQNLDTRVSTVESKCQNLNTLIEKLQENVNSIDTRVTDLENK